MKKIFKSEKGWKRLKSFFLEWLSFETLGLIFATPGIVLRYFIIENVNIYIVFGINAAIISAGFLGGKLIELVVHNFPSKISNGRKQMISDFIHYFVLSILGVGCDWLIGNAPWNNVDYSQPQLWVYWNAVTFLPKVFLKHYIYIQKILALLLFLGLFGGELALGILLVQKPSVIYGNAALSIIYFLLQIFIMWYLKTIYSIVKMEEHEEVEYL